MAASSAGNPPPFFTMSSQPKRFEFSPDPPLKISLTSEQYKHCSEALQFFKEKLRTPERIAQEFAYLQAIRITPSQMARSCVVALDSVNVNKNRYLDVVPFDQNRVVLNPCKDYRPSARGYINASFITTSSSDNISQFIATQGPLPHTYEDFWEMIIQHHCPVIVMLTRLVDNCKTVKCGDYFQAEDGPRDFGNISIVTKWIKTTDNSSLLRNLEVGYKEVLGIQVINWNFERNRNCLLQMVCNCRGKQGIRVLELYPSENLQLGSCLHPAALRLSWDHYFNGHPMSADIFHAYHHYIRYLPEWRKII